MDGNPQKEEGYTPISHELLEAVIPRLPAQWAVFFAVARMTYGWSDKTAEITTEKMIQLTGIIHRQNIGRAVRQAKNMGLINVIKSDYGKGARYSINKRYRAWKDVIKSSPVIKNDYKMSSNPVETEVPTIRLKQIKKARPVFTPPKGEDLKANGHPWLDAEAWDDFVTHRATLTKAKPFTEVAVKRMLMKLSKFKDQHAAMIENSITSGWSGVFPERFQNRPGNQEPRKRKLLTPQGEPT